MSNKAARVNSVVFCWSSWKEHYCLFSIITAEAETAEFVIKLDVRASATPAQSDSQDTSVRFWRIQTGATVSVLVLVSYQFFQYRSIPESCSILDIYILSLIFIPSRRTLSNRRTHPFSTKETCFLFLSC